MTWENSPAIVLIILMHIGAIMDKQVFRVVVFCWLSFIAMWVYTIGKELGL